MSAATASNSTRASSAPDRDLEGQILDLRRAASMVRVLFDDVLDYEPAKSPPAWLKLEHLAPAGQLAFIMTEDDFVAIDYAIGHLIELARKIDASFQTASVQTRQLA